MKQEQQKISIRFFNDREVRALWDDEQDKWWKVRTIANGLTGFEVSFSKLHFKII